MLKSLFAPLAMKVAGGLAALSMAACLFLYISLLGEQRHSAKLETRAVAAEKDVETLQASIAQLEADSEARAREQQAELRIAREQGKALSSQARRLRDSSRQIVDGPCTISDTLRNAEGL